MVFKTVLKIIKASLIQFVWIGLLISFLLFFLNILLWISHNLWNFSEDVRHKLGTYFYIREADDQITKDDIYSEVITMIDELEQAWLRVEYYSKDDALQLIEKRFPDVIKNLEKYSLENPLPPTLYVIFDDKQKYEKSQEIISKYNDIILDFEDSIKGRNFQEQESRVQNIINLSNFVVMFSYFLIFMLGIIIISFLLLVIKITFYNFYKQIEIEKLMWAYYLQIKIPFFFKVALLLSIGFICMFLYFSFFFTYLNTYFVDVFDINIMEYLAVNKMFIYQSILIQYVVFMWLGLLISNIFLSRLIRKV